MGSRIYMGFMVYVEEFRLTHTVVQDVQAYHASYALHDALLRNLKTPQ